MDLISRKDAVTRISDLLILELNGKRIPTWNEVYNAIGDIPSVPAVPLDKLCLLLHDIAGCPCYTQQGEEMCNRLIGDQCNTEWDDVECWKRFLAKWMEEQDARKEN